MKWAVSHTKTYSKKDKWDGKSYLDSVDFPNQEFKLPDGHN